MQSFPKADVYQNTMLYALQPFSVVNFISVKVGEKNFPAAGNSSSPQDRCSPVMNEAAPCVLCPPLLTPGLGAGGQIVLFAPLLLWELLLELQFLVGTGHHLRPLAGLLTPRSPYSGPPRTAFCLATSLPQLHGTGTKGNWL